MRKSGITLKQTHHKQHIINKVKTASNQIQNIKTTPAHNTIKSQTLQHNIQPSI